MSSVALILDKGFEIQPCACKHVVSYPFVQRQVQKEPYRRDTRGVVKLN